MKYGIAVVESAANMSTTGELATKVVDAIKQLALVVQIEFQKLHTL